MTGLHHIVGAFRPLRESAQAAFQPDRIKGVRPSGEQLVGLALVTGVPDDVVLR